MLKQRIILLLIILSLASLSLFANKTLSNNFFTTQIYLLKKDLHNALSNAPMSILTKTSTNCNITIPASGSTNHVVTSTISVSESGVIQDLNVKDLDIDHTYLDDLIIKLTSPAGTEVTLISRKRGSNNNIYITLDDEAASSTLPCPPTNGASYQPESALSVFDGDRYKWKLDTYSNGYLSF